MKIRLTVFHTQDICTIYTCNLEFIIYTGKRSELNPGKLLSSDFLQNHPTPLTLILPRSVHSIQLLFRKILDFFPRNHKEHHYLDQKEKVSKLNETPFDLRHWGRQNKEKKVENICNISHEPRKRFNFTHHVEIYKITKLPIIFTCRHHNSAKPACKKLFRLKRSARWVEDSGKKNYNIPVNHGWLHKQSKNTN